MTSPPKTANSQSLKERPASLRWLSFTVKSICDGVSNKCTRVWTSCSAGSLDSAYSRWWIKNNGGNGCWTERELLREVVWKCIHLTGIKEFCSDWRESQSREMSWLGWDQRGHHLAHRQWRWKRWIPPQQNQGFSEQMKDQHGRYGSLRNWMSMWCDYAHLRRRCPAADPLCGYS